MKKFEIRAIGEVVRGENEIVLQIDEKFRKGLLHLDTFSHAHVFWWADRYDGDEYQKVTRTQLPYADNMESGVFACLSPVRPNAMMTTVCEILSVDEEKGLVKIKNIDAFNGTPVLDLKPYYPICDYVKDSKISEWLVGWPDEFPAEGMGLMEHELE